MKLEHGKLYQLPGGQVIEVLRVDFSGATVRPVNREQRTFETKEGRRVVFEAPANSFLVSTNSIIEEVSNETSE